MNFQKPTLWILESNISNQMVFAEMLDNKYEVIFFDDLASILRFQKLGHHVPSLVVVNLESQQIGLEALLSSTTIPGAIALAPLSVSPQTVVNNSAFFDQTLCHPYSKSQVFEAIEECYQPIKPTFKIFHLAKKSATSVRTTM